MATLSLLPDAAVLRWASRRRSRPRLSVVVPVYNVERYLAECLESLLSQTWRDFEAILVVDGATDASLAIAQGYAELDDRIRVVVQPNAGLGAARNAGVKLCSGEYLTFLDSDDVLPPDAYSSMLSTIEATGSDIVIGTLARNLGDGQRIPRLMQQNHQLRREHVTVREMPLILADVFAVNKMFRRSFWRRAGLAFPEGTRYEDQPTLTRALLSAASIDVIDDVVYLWRAREDGSSISQRRHDIADLADRIATKRTSRSAMQSLGDPAVWDLWVRKVLPVDMCEYFLAVPGCSSEYWDMLRSAVLEFWPATTLPFDRTSVPAWQRRCGQLVSEGRREELEQLVATVVGRRAGTSLADPAVLQAAY